jgi:hypothetical protein
MIQPRVAVYKPWQAIAPLAFKMPPDGDPAALAEAGAMAINHGQEPAPGATNSPRLR